YADRDADPELRPPALQALLTSLRKAGNSAERLKLMERYQGRSVRDKQYLQVALSALVLQDAAALTLPECLRAEEILGEFASQMRVPLRPVEAHLLWMLQDADPALDRETIELALRTRMAAEAAALGGGDGATRAPWYAAALHAWTHTVVDQGDAA